MSQLTADSLKHRLIFLTGKGGVGKTTVAWALAANLSKQNRKVAMVTWNPLGSAVGFLDTVDLIALEPMTCFHEYVIKYLKFEAIYETVFDNHVLKTFIRAAPGLSETVIAGKIWDLFESRKYDHLIVDLPSSGHAYSFFHSPLALQKIFPSGIVHREAAKIAGMFFSKETRVDLVTIPEELAARETTELYENLQKLGSFQWGHLFINYCLPEWQNLKSDIPEISEYIHDYEAALELQKAAIKPLNSLPLHSVFLHKHTTTEWKETTWAVEEQLCQS